MDAIMQWEGEFLLWIQNTMRAEWLTPIMKGITMLGEVGIFGIVICLIMLIIPKTRRLGVICSLALAFSFVCCNLIIKPLVDRTRPWLVIGGLINLMPDPGDASFPSGHTTNTISPAWAMFLATMPFRVEGRRTYDPVPCLGWKGVGADPRTMHRLSYCAVIIAVLIGLSRLYLGMHFPTDVICGLLLGMISATIVYSIIRGIELRRGLIGCPTITAPPIYASADKLEKAEASAETVTGEQQGEDPGAEVIKKAENDLKVDAAEAYDAEIAEVVAELEKIASTNAETVADQEESDVQVDAAEADKDDEAVSSETVAEPEKSDVPDDAAESEELENPATVIEPEKSDTPVDVSEEEGTVEEESPVIQEPVPEKGPNNRKGKQKLKRPRGRKVKLGNGS